ncbi:unnamed protein product [Cladocopium goreaui]|uniref:Retrovirus-related Pol polyprotein from transposon TNT 1-94 n=1 Tax=Cladocopium goreaui TaxID=2562237 RepID=A0A9P1CXT7_9DINO|nr:unnamed protein product [Cladocopium goreaui]
MATGSGGVPTEAQLILASVQAAQAASDTAVTLREASKNRPGYSSNLNDVEERTELPVTFSETPEGFAITNMSFKLYAISAGILKSRPLRLLRQRPNSNGLQVWRQLRSLYAPKTKVRSMAILSAIMGHPAFTKPLGDEHDKIAGVNIAEDILLTTFVRCLPHHVQQHIQLGTSRFETV